jgi:uncharacterized membrane protein
MSRRFIIYLAFVLSLCILRPLAQNATGSYYFLIWNLFLAGLPLFFALFLKRLRASPQKWYLGLMLWLLFFPNAPYIITDLVHLNHSAGFHWYDSLLFFAAGVAGLKFTFDSLAIVIEELKLGMPRVPSQFWRLGFLGLAAFGVYLGRYLRFNSWDIVQSPYPLLKACYELVRHPFAHQQEWFMIGVYSIFLLTLQQIWPSDKEVLES